MNILLSGNNFLETVTLIILVLKTFYINFQLTFFMNQVSIS